MTTKITTGNHAVSLSGSPEKRIDVAPDGTLWTLLVVAGNPGLAKFFYSRDGGATWTVTASGDINLGQTYTPPSFFIDADGYAHVAFANWDKDPQVIVYWRGTPTGTATTAPGWKWARTTVSPANGRTGSDTDVIAFRVGAGWTAWVSYDMKPLAGAKVARIAIAANGTASVANVQHGPPTGTVVNQYGTLEFAHNGDGRTPSASPHIFYTTAVGSGTSGAVRLNRATYAAGGTWSWDAPVSLPAAQTTRTAIVSAFDGTRLMVAYASQSNSILCYEWAGSGAATARNPPALPGDIGGDIMSISMAIDPVTDDVYLAWQDATNGDIRWSKFTRATTTWSAWATAVTQGSITSDGKIQLIRHPTRDSVDMVYANGTDPNWNIWYQQLAVLPRTPNPPTLKTPASGTRTDLASGGTFTWTYNKVSPGDAQQAWALRRTLGSTTEYWNVLSQSWSSTVVFNAGGNGSVTFGAGMWTNGNTYSWSVKSRSTNGLDTNWATDRAIIATSAPVVAVTGPKGVYYAESTPLVSWTYSSLDAQRSYEVRIVAESASIDDSNPGPAVWTSGVTQAAGARNARVTTALENGKTYRAYVQAVSVTGIASAWAASQFSIQIVPPAEPVVEVLDEVYYPTGVPRIRLDVQAQTSFLTDEQDAGTDGWINDQNATIAPVAADFDNQILAGFSITTLSNGLAGALTDVGDPPLSPFGEPQALGPLSFPVLGGRPYTALASLRADSTTRAARTRIRWYDADDGTGALISESVGEQVDLDTDVYQQVIVTDLAPVGAALGRMVVEIVGATGGGEMFYVAKASFHPGRGDDYQPGGLSSIQVVRIERSDDDGATWNTIVQRAKTNLAQQAVLYDRGMPLGVDVLYRAYTEADTGDGSLLTSGVSLIATMALASPAWTIRDLGDDVGEMLAYVTGHDRTDDESSSVHWPGGREYPLVDTEGPQAATGTLSIFVYNSDLAAAKDVLRRTVPMVVQSPSGDVFTARLIRRKYGITAGRHRTIDVDYVEIEAQTGG